MQYEKTLNDAKEDFDKNILPALEEFVRIDNLSPCYDPEWETNGKAEKAGMLLLNWAKNQGIKGLKGELYKEKGKTHMLFIEIESQGINKTILLYGHFDKQPSLGQWGEGLHPNKPILKDGLLYGRGSSDDGYALFAIIEAIKLIQIQKGKHGRIVITIESGEESCCLDIVSYNINLKERIGNPDLMICMDSGCKDYSSLWLTTSLRGMVNFDLQIECLKESVHSGIGGGLAPDSFNVLRTLLNRLDDSKTSKVVEQLNVKIPQYRIDDAENLAKYLQEKTISDLVKLGEGVQPLTGDYKEAILNNTWRPSVVVIGMSGLPEAEAGGNLLSSGIKVRISIRLPPTLDRKEAEKMVTDILTRDPPYNSKITVKCIASINGWAAKDMEQSLKKSFSKSSTVLFGKDYYNCGEGGSIPVIAELGKLYPQCEIVVTGVLGPGSNAHSVNECLNIDYTIRMIVALSHAIYDFSNN